MSKTTFVKYYRLAKYTPLTDGPLPAAKDADEARAAAPRQLLALDAASGTYALIDDETRMVIGEFTVSVEKTVEEVVGE